MRTLRRAYSSINTLPSVTLSARDDVPRRNGRVRAGAPSTPVLSGPPRARGAALTHRIALIRFCRPTRGHCAPSPTLPCDDRAAHKPRPLRPHAFAAAAPWPPSVLRHADERPLPRGLVYLPAATASRSHTAIDAHAIRRHPPVPAWHLHVVVRPYVVHAASAVAWRGHGPVPVRGGSIALGDEATVPTKRGTIRYSLRPLRALPGLRSADCVCPGDDSPQLRYPT
jgi:hypothetical protein